MKNLYKEQLDNMINEKRRVKDIEREKDQEEKKRYQQQLLMNQEAEKNKEKTYKDVLISSITSIITNL